MLAWSALGKVAAMAPPTERFQRELDTGLFWLSAEGSMHREMGRGRASPAVVYLHGWEVNRVAQGFRESFHYPTTDPASSAAAPELSFTADAFLSAGWRVGTYYWDQWSDEPNVADAEAKIWTTGGPKGMRYRLGEGRFAGERPVVTDSRAVAERVADAIAEDCACATELRLVGHSLGSQLALQVASLLMDSARAGLLPGRLVPRRVSLLDPFFPTQSFANPQTWLTTAERSRLGGASTVDLCATRVRRLAAEGVAIDRYVSSGIPDIPGVTSQRPELSSALPTVRFRVGWATTLEARHLACPALYFASMRTGHEAQGLFPWQDVGVARVPSAAMSDEHILHALERSGLSRSLPGEATPRQAPTSPARAWRQASDAPPSRRRPLGFYEVFPGLPGGLLAKML